MKTQHKNWMDNPSMTQVSIYTIAWFISLVLIVLSVTNLFTESFFKGNGMIIYILIVGATGATLKLNYSYWKNKVKA